MNEILTTRSRKWGERKWRFVGERDHVTYDGRGVTLKVWRGACVKCGQPYEVATAGGPRSRAFTVVTCPAHRGKAPRASSRPKIGADGRHPLLQCGLLAAHFDFAAHTARLDLPAGHCVDMMGCIQFCRSVDPGVIAIATLSGEHPDTRYFKGDDGWRAYDAPRKAAEVAA
jgi:hypothetical protein